MSAELTEAERANQLAHAIYATGALNLPLSDRIDVDCHDAARAVIGSGWVSPKEAKAREAAARREALLEVRRSVAVIRTPLNNLVGLSRAQAFHVGVGEVATLLDNTLLAEPERDKEGR